MSWMGTILRINLTKGKIESEPTSKYTEDYIGGGGIGAKLIYDGVAPEVRAFDPENMLTFNTGPLTGTLLGNKCEVMAKSPEHLSNRIVSPGIGGQFANEIKFAGYDNIVITGKAEEPVYIYINNDNVEIRDASQLWGMDVPGTQEKIKNELNDPDVKIACIGVAGENRVFCAAIRHDIKNCASQGGLGGVMGSKNLKAVVVRGTKGVKIANHEAHMQHWNEYWNHYTKGDGATYTKLFHKEGYARNIPDYYPFRDIIEWGFASGSYVCPPQSKEELGSEFWKKYMVGPLGCAFCFVHCQENYSVPGIDNGGISCQSYMNYRWQLKNQNMKTWWKATARAQRHGLGGIMMSTLTGFLMLLYEKGIISAKETDGVPMEWGSEEAILTCIEKVARKEGFGALFAENMVKGLMTISNGRVLELIPGMKLADLGRPHGVIGSYLGIRGTSQFIYFHPATWDIDSVIGWYSEELGISVAEAEAMCDKWADDFAERTTGNKDAWRADTDDGGLMIKCGEDVISSCDISGHCDFNSDRYHVFGTRGGVDEVSKWISATTGTEITSEKLLEVIHRKRLLELSYSIMCEKKVSADVPFPKLARRKDGFWLDSKEDKVDPAKIEQASEDYYAIRGCDPKTGIPTREVLEKLKLKDVAEKLGLPEKLKN